jgi:hypothetical protein
LRISQSVIAITIWLKKQPLFCCCPYGVYRAAVCSPGHLCSGLR